MSLCQIFSGSSIGRGKSEAIIPIIFTVFCKIKCNGTNITIIQLWHCRLAYLKEADESGHQVFVSNEIASIGNNKGC